LSEIGEETFTGNVTSAKRAFFLTGIITLVDKTEYILK
jgi:hypothetical protein